MNEHMNIPDKLHVGFQERTDTYTGKLGYVIYTDEKGKRRKEGSWDGWRDYAISPMDIDNIPTSGFILNRSAGGVGSGWGWNDRVEKVRVYDPRDFEFEISIPNLLFILSECNAHKGKGLEGEFVYAWAGTELVLLPVSSQEYITSTEFTNAQQSKVTKADMIEGATYLHKDMSELVYVGRLPYRDIDSYHSSLSDQYDYYAESKKMHIFYNTDTDRFVPERGFTRLSKRIDSTTYHDYAAVYSKYVDSAHHSNVKCVELREVPIGLAILQNQCNLESTLYGRVLVEYRGGDNLTLMVLKRYGRPQRPYNTSLTPDPITIQRKDATDPTSLSVDSHNVRYGLTYSEFVEKFPELESIKLLVPVIVLESGQTVNASQFYTIKEYQKCQ